MEWDVENRRRPHFLAIAIMYRRDYAAYYEKCKHVNSPAIRDANPTVILVPGLGLAAWGKDKSESRVTAEFYGCAIEVMRGAEAADVADRNRAQLSGCEVEGWDVSVVVTARTSPLPGGMLDLRARGRAGPAVSAGP